MNSIVVYSKIGRFALATSLEDPPEHSEALESLRERLLAKGYTVIDSLPVDSIADWAAEDTHRLALRMAVEAMRRKKKQDPARTPADGQPLAERDHHDHAPTTER